nr:MAG TPA: hypothetical protein [Caudoviricetes sp.]
MPSVLLLADFQVFQVACNHLLSMVVYTSH